MSHYDDFLAGDPARDDMLVLVDGLDREVGTATKLQAHAEGLLHRAFSVVLVRPSEHGERQSALGARDGGRGPELLLAKRSMQKYHSGGLWANSCCSHPRAGEGTLDAAYRRVREELGCEAAGLREVAAF
ncbi:MAG: NUDIX domain-containing protein, partial [Eggerthellaceae bacterium]|nr:NUDIX domain-containing protein [Eggerthellaceae bacterium]